MNPVLEGKRALIFGATGSIGRRVAKEFLAEGADVYISGRSQANVDNTAAELGLDANRAAVVDAADPEAVDRYIADVAREGAVDITFNAAGPTPDTYGNGTRAIDSTLGQLSAALDYVLKPQWVTASAAARQMVKQRSGVVLFQTGSPARGHTHGASSIGTAFGAMETFAENLAFEVGQYGVRVICLRTTANYDSAVIRLSAAQFGKADDESYKEVVRSLAELNFLKTPMSIDDTAQILAFFASERAKRFTGTVVNATAGSAPD